MILGGIVKRNLTYKFFQHPKFNNVFLPKHIYRDYHEFFIWKFKKSTLIHHKLCVYQNFTDGKEYLNNFENYPFYLKNLDINLPLFEVNCALGFQIKNCEIEIYKKGSIDFVFWINCTNEGK